MVKDLFVTQTNESLGGLEGVGGFINPDFPDHIISGQLDTRNVIDHYKNWEEVAIREDLQNNALPFHAVAENFAHDFNIATLVRNVNAFNLSNVTIVGRRKWDRRGAVGTQHYTQVNHEKDAVKFYETIIARGEPLIVVDNVQGAENVQNFEWPEGPLHVVFGQEMIGVSNVSLSYATHCIQIPQRGSVRSLNVGVASGIVMYDYVSKVS